MLAKTFFNIKGRETLALITLNLVVVVGLVVFYLFVLRSRTPEPSEVLGSTNCTKSYIDGFVYNDKNANGKRDSGEASISKITIRVTTKSGDIYTVTNPGDGDTDTGNDGVYKVCLSQDTAFKIEFSNVPGGYYPGPRGNDSRTLVSFGNLGNENKLTYSLGLVTTSDTKLIEIGNRVWEDDGDGIQEVGEPGIRGLTVRLVLYNNRSKEIARATTDSNGEFYFNSKNDSDLVDENTYLILIDKSEFQSKLNGYRTTDSKKGNNGELDSDTQEGQEFVEIPVVIGSAASCSMCIHDYDIGVQRVRQTNTTPTPYIEPDFPSCPSNMNRVTLTPQANGVLFRDRDPKVLTHSFNLSSKSDLYIVGIVKEGHPEEDCPNNPTNPRCVQGQKFESFKYELDGNEFGRYLDKGAEVNAWSNVGPWNFSNIASGSHQLKFSHLLQGTTAESVDYKFTVCMKSVSTSTPSASPTATVTNTPSPTTNPTNTATPSASPTATRDPEVSGTPTSTATATPSPSATGTTLPTNTATVTSTRSPEASVTSTATPSGEVLGEDDQRLPDSGYNDVIMPIMIGFGSVMVGLILMSTFYRNKKAMIWGRSKR